MWKIIHVESSHKNLSSLKHNTTFHPKPQNQKQTQATYINVAHYRSDVEIETLKKKVHCFYTMGLCFDMGLEK